MGDQWLELRRQLLISRDKGDTLSRRFRFRLSTSISSTSSTLSLHPSLSLTVPLATPSPFSHLSWPLVLIPLFLHASDLGLATCWSKLPTAVPRSRSWALVLLLPFGEVRLTPCQQRWCPVRNESACCRTDENLRLRRDTSVPVGSVVWGCYGGSVVCVCVCVCV